MRCILDIPQSGFRIACERENTIQSLKQAAKKGADLVEFDVQLTKDLQPIIYHDFHVLVEVAHRTGIAGEKIYEEAHHQMAIKDLKLGQLNLLHFEHVHVKMKGPSTTDCERVIPTKAELSRSLEQADANDEDYNPFPSLETALQIVNEHVGFNIEVKYPMQMKVGLSFVTITRLFRTAPTSAKATSRGTNTWTPS